MTRDVALKKAKRFKPFTAWMLVDDLDTYADSLHLTRADALCERDANLQLIDSKWRIVRVRVTPA